jgi:hypothetical protein
MTLELEGMDWKSVGPALINGEWLKEDKGPSKRLVNATNQSKRPQRPSCKVEVSTIWSRAVLVAKKYRLPQSSVGPCNGDLQSTYWLRETSSDRRRLLGL